MTPSPKKAARRLRDFIHKTAILKRNFCFTPLRRVLQIPLLIYELFPDLCRSRFMTLRGKVFIGPPSLFSGCFYHDCRDGAWKNRTRKIMRLHLAPAPFISPMWLLMIFRAVHYMLPAFPRMYCKSRGKVLFEVLRRTQVKAAASCKLNITWCNTANKRFKWYQDILKMSIDPPILISRNNVGKENINELLLITCR